MSIAVCIWMHAQKLDKDETERLNYRSESFNRLKMAGLINNSDKVAYAIDESVELSGHTARHGTNSWVTMNRHAIVDEARISRITSIIARE